MRVPLPFIVLASVPWVFLREFLQPGGEQRVFPVINRTVDDGGQLLAERSSGMGISFSA